METREDNNQRGKDASFDQTVPQVHSPVKFDKQRKREVFHRRDGYLSGNAHEHRFTAFNDVPVTRSKHRTYQSPAFEKWADHSIDEFIKNPSSCARENANNQAYYPVYTLVRKNLQAGPLAFEGYSSKESRRTRLGFEYTPQPADYDLVRRGFMMTRKQDQDAVPFKLMGGRDDKLYQRKHGLPKETKEEAAAIKKMYEKKVDFKEFLPNSIVDSAKKKLHSNTFKTQALGLYHVNGGWGTSGARCLVGSYDGAMTQKPKYWSSKGLRAGRAASMATSARAQSEDAIAVNVKAREVTTEADHSTTGVDPASQRITVLDDSKVRHSDQMNITIDCDVDLEKVLEVGPRQLRSERPVPPQEYSELLGKEVQLQLAMLDVDPSLNDRRRHAKLEKKLLAEKRRTRIA